MKAQLLGFDLEWILRCTFHSRVPCRIKPRLGLVWHQPSLGIFFFPVPPSLISPPDAPWERFLNQSLAHKSLAPSGGPVVSPGLAHPSCSVNICCLSEWIHEWMNKLGKSQAGGIRTGYYTNYRLSTFFPFALWNRLAPWGISPTLLKQTGCLLNHLVCFLIGQSIRRWSHLPRGRRRGLIAQDEGPGAGQTLPQHLQCLSVTGAAGGNDHSGMNQLNLWPELQFNSLFPLH